MKYPLLTEIRSEDSIRTGKAFGAVKLLQRIHKNIVLNRKLSPGFVPFKELARLIQLEDEYQDAENEAGLGAAPEKAAEIFKEGRKKAADLSKKRKGEILWLEGAEMEGKFSVRFLFSIIGRRVSQREAIASLNKHIIPLLGDPEFVSYGKPRIINSAKREDDVLFPVDAVNYDIELPIN